MDLTKNYKYLKKKINKNLKYRIIASTMWPIMLSFGVAIYGNNGVWLLTNQLHRVCLPYILITQTWTH